MSEEVKREVQTWDPVEWLDRIINGEQTYTLQEVPGNSGHYKLVPDNVEVIQKGTPLSQSRLNRMTVSAFHITLSVLLLPKRLDRLDLHTKTDR